MKPNNLPHILVDNESDFIPFLFNCNPLPFPVIHITSFVCIGKFIHYISNNSTIVKKKINATKDNYSRQNKLKY